MAVVQQGPPGEGGQITISRDKKVPKYQYYVNKSHIWTIWHYKIATKCILDRKGYHLLKIQGKSGGCKYIEGHPQVIKYQNCDQNE